MIEKVPKALGSRTVCGSNLTMISVEAAALALAVLVVAELAAEKLA